MQKGFYKTQSAAVEVFSQKPNKIRQTFPDCKEMVWHVFLRINKNSKPFVAKGGSMKADEQNYERDNLTGINEHGPSENVPVRRLTATSIIGDKVENNHGDKLGKINNLMVNIENGIIEYVVLEFGSVWGFGGKLFAIPFKEMFLDEGKKVFIIDRDKKYLENIPGFDKHHWPETNDHRYFDYVRNYWTGTIHEKTLHEENARTLK